MSHRTLGQLFLVGGLVLVMVAILADPIGLGGFPGFGRRQVALLIIGLVLATLGFWRLRKT